MKEGVNVFAIVAPAIDVPVSSPGTSVTTVVERRNCESTVDHALDQVAVSPGVLSYPMDDRHYASHGADR